MTPDGSRQHDRRMHHSGFFVCGMHSSMQPQPFDCRAAGQTEGAVLAGHEVTKRDVVAVVHVGQATLSKRMDEFASTSAAELSIIEFEDAVKAADASQQQLLQETASRQALEGPPAEGRSSVGCSHTREGGYARQGV